MAPRLSSTADSAVCLPNCFWIRKRQKEEKPSNSPGVTWVKQEQTLRCERQALGLVLYPHGHSRCHPLRCWWGHRMSGWVVGPQCPGQTGRAAQPGRTMGCLDIQLRNRCLKRRLEPQGWQAAGQFPKAMSAVARSGLSCTITRITGTACSPVRQVPSEQECSPPPKNCESPCNKCLALGST